MGLMSEGIWFQFVNHLRHDWSFDVKKSLIVIASALVLTVGAATSDRLRYDSSVFADPVGPYGPRATRVEYPPCIKGVREDRCIQLYERGVRQSYARWLAAHGRGPAMASQSGRDYRPCRGHRDDECRQVHGRWHMQQAQRRAPHGVRIEQAATRPARVYTPAPQRSALRPASQPRPRSNRPISTPGI
jgi:hypothetical protein